jgi:acetylornithine deacetylase/succinyl-diaminopimelate desuccinylase-like protein
LHNVVDELWPGTPIIPSMMVGASDSVYTMAVGLPSYGIGGAGIDFDDDRMHGRDERIRVASFYKSVEFFYLYLKALTRP